MNAQELNIAYPDTHTNYWVQPYTMTPQSPPIVITGQYPFARYFSFVTYTSDTSDGLPIHGSLHDSEIVPDSGRVNPFATSPEPSDPNQRRYTVSITPRRSRPPARPTCCRACPQGAASVTGFLAYRLYLPNNPSDPPGAPVPQLTIDGSPLTTCSDLEQRILGHHRQQPVAVAALAVGRRDLRQSRQPVPDRRHGMGAGAAGRRAGQGGDLPEHGEPGQRVGHQAHPTPLLGLLQRRSA